MKSIIFGIGLLLLSYETLGFTFNPVYKNGQEVCQEHATERVDEISLYVSVPVNYQSPNGEQTLIYTYLKRPFNPNLPSMVFFTGGPGVSSRSSEFSLEHFNVIFIEQRGISCSRPVRESLFLDPAFYSTENTARDVRKVVQAYNLKKVSVYGHSYGTVAATVFASFYPEIIRSVVLEGVVFKADASLWRDQNKLTMIQNFFNELPRVMKDKILSLSKTPGVPESWFSKVANMMMYLNNGLKSFNYFLEQVLLMDDESFKNFISNFYSNPDRPEEEFSFGDVTMGMIGCQEMSMADTGLSMISVFQDEMLVSNQFNDDQKNACVPLKITHQKEKIYTAKKYPIKVPVFYLLGEHDGATPLSQGLAHYEQIAKDKKQALILLQGGHLPMLDLLKNNRACHNEEDCRALKQYQTAVEIFEQLLLGNTLPPHELKRFNESGELQWKTY